MAARGAASTPDLPRELPMVGRKSDLERLYRLFGHESRVEPTILVTGDPGVGKSRLAGAVAAEARRRGWTVAEGRAYPVETGMPYSLLSDAFLPILSAFDPAALTVLTRGTSSELRQLFPALEGPDADLDEWDPGESRTRLFWGFTEFLKRLAEREPLLIVAEDLHWADPSSLSLLHFLARQLDGAPIRVLGTAAWGYTKDLEALGQFERSLASMGRLARHELAPLTLEATDELVQAVFQMGGPPVREFTSALYDWTHGNPYFLEETLKALVHTGRLHRQNGTWIGWDARSLDLPGSVRDALLLRLASLSPGARAAADLVAVGGGRAPVRLVGLVGGADDDELLGAVEELTALGVLDELEEGRDVVLQFRHPMVRETLYQDLGATRRRLLHRQFAEGLETLHEGREAPVDQLAYHFTRGGAAGADARSARYLAEAGRAALRRHADREAVAYLEAALERYPRGSGVDRGLPPRPAIETDLARGYGRLGRLADAGAIWSGLFEGARAEGRSSDAADALRHLGLLAFWSGRHDEALRHFDRALETLTDADAEDAAGDEALAARVLLAAGVALQELGRPDDARLRIEGCLERARSLDDPTLLGRAHRALALLFTWVGRADDARRHGWQAIELADRAGDPYVRFWGRWALASLEGLTGHTDEMARLMRQARQVSEELRSPVLGLWAAELEVEYAYAVGDWDEAIAHGERAIELATALGQTTLLPRLLVWTATVYLGRGAVDRGREMVDRAWSLAGLDGEGGGDARRDVHVVVPAHIGQAACLLAQGRYDEAVEVGEAGVALADRVGYVFWSLHLLLPIIAEAHVRRRDLASAAKLGQRMRREGQRIGHRLATAWADTCDALVLWVSGDVERGLGMLQGAARALEGIPMKYDAARVRRQVAGRLAELGRRDEALAELRRVHDAFDELGAQPELDACREMFREIDSRPPTKTRGGRAADLTPREWDVAVQVSRRLSNKAVAKELGMSPRTVTTHLSNIYRKLDIGSRGELVDMVREGRLAAPEG